MPTWAGSGRAARVLAGFSYAPVARAYVALRAGHRPTHRGRIEVIACFGGSDPAQVTRRLAGTLAADEGWRTTIVVGADYAGLIGDLPAEVVRDPADLPERLSRADLAVIGAGTMKFEVACLGRPAILLAVADDQLAVGPPFALTGAAEYLGDGRTIEPGALLAAVRRLVHDDGRRLAIGRAAAAAVDGGGAERVATAILSLAGHPPT
jgi:spore coat polysaccharide biosynthesis predicted glycosyltransferase SpsG